MNDSFVESLYWIKDIYEAMFKNADVRPIIQKIEWAEEWMASGFQVYFDPTCGTPETMYQMVITCIFEPRWEDTTIVKCIRAQVINLINNKVAHDVKSSEENGFKNLSTNDLVDFWIKYRELDQKIMDEIKDDDSIFSPKIS